MRAPGGEEKEEGEAKEEVWTFGTGIACLVCAPYPEHCWLQSRGYTLWNASSSSRVEPIEYPAQLD
jgi:hypothetical protein